MRTQSIVSWTLVSTALLGCDGASPVDVSVNYGATIVATPEARVPTKVEQPTEVEQPEVASGKNVEAKPPKLVEKVDAPEIHDLRVDVKPGEVTFRFVADANAVVNVTIGNGEVADEHTLVTEQAEQGSLSPDGTTREFTLLIPGLVACEDYWYVLRVEGSEAAPVRGRFSLGETTLFPNTLTLVDEYGKVSALVATDSVTPIGGWIISKDKRERSPWMWPFSSLEPGRLHGITFPLHGPRYELQGSFFCRGKNYRRSIELNIDCWPGDYGESFRPAWLGLDYPRNVGLDWTGSFWLDSTVPQGVTHSGDDWFFATKQYIHRIPVTADLADESLVFPSQRLPEWMRDDGYTHIGDLDAAKGLLYVPVEQEDGGYRKRPLLWLVSVDGKEPEGMAVFPPAPHSESNEAPWVAVSPIDGLVYTSAFDLDSRAGRNLWVYRLNRLNQAPYYELEFVREVPLYEEDGTTPAFLPGVQGGVFSPMGHLYLASDPESSNGFVHGFDISTGRRRAHFTIDKRGDQELEGMDFWDRSDGKSPGVSGRLHVLMQWKKRAEHFSTAIWFKHYDTVKATRCM